MAIVLIDDQYLVGIADAIRSASGTTQTYTTAQMAPAISLLSSGDSETVVTESLVEGITVMKLEVSNIPNGILNDYTSLTKLHSTAETIEDYALSGCSGLTTLNLPNVVSMGYCPLYGNDTTDIQYANFGENVEVIDLRTTPSTTINDSSERKRVMNLIIRNTTTIPMLRMDYILSDNRYGLTLYVPASMLSAYETKAADTMSNYNFYADNIKTLDDLPENIDELLEVN